jgi:hypothetical protein
MLPAEAYEMRKRLVTLSMAKPKEFGKRMSKYSLAPEDGRINV